MTDNGVSITGVVALRSAPMGRVLSGAEAMTSNATTT